MLVSAHAMNGGGPTAQIIERSTWSTTRDFVGHKKAISCVRFNRDQSTGGVWMILIYVEFLLLNSFIYPDTFSRVNWLSRAHNGIQKAPNGLANPDSQMTGPIP